MVTVATLLFAQHYKASSCLILSQISHNLQEIVIIINPFNHERTIRKTGIHAKYGILMKYRNLYYYTPIKRCCWCFCWGFFCCFLFVFSLIS